MTRNYIWDELTTAEQSEAIERGFKRGEQIRYVIHTDGKYRGGWKLAKWIKVDPTPEQAVKRRAYYNAYLKGEA